MNAAKEVANGASTRGDIEDIKKIVEENKKISVHIGGADVQRQPTEAQEAYTRP